MAHKYFGNWSTYEDMIRDWNATTPDMPTPRQIVFAVYSTPSYDGSALVIYRQNGKLYEVHGSHCSCYGLEDQWSPEETSRAALKMRIPNGPPYEFYDAGDDAWKRFVELFG